MSASLVDVEDPQAQHPWPRTHVAHLPTFDSYIRPGAQSTTTGGPELDESRVDRLDVGELATALPGELSGGEVQRAALARALVTGPQVVFADEPTGALDTVGGEALLDVLLSTARERGASVVLVTHDNRVAAHADREVVLVDGAFTAAGVRS